MRVRFARPDVYPTFHPLARLIALGAVVASPAIALAMPQRHQVPPAEDPANEPVPLPDPPPGPVPDEGPPVEVPVEVPVEAPPAEDAPPPKKDFRGVRGTIVDADTGEGIPDVLIEVVDSDE